jgi:hypothetical protein
MKLEIQIDKEAQKLQNRIYNYYNFEPPQKIAK